jgi:histidine triad (HIT) family protein
MTDCLFCKIVAGAIPAKLLLETPHVVAFRDVRPVAPSHALVIPRVHVSGVGASEATAETFGHVLAAAKTVAADLGLAESGYRLVINEGPDAGQSVFHLHCHVLGGRALAWPPG